MEIEPGKIYHIYNRGNNQIPIFYEAENYRYFLRKMRAHLSPFSKIMAWCLMPNHFHWMLFADDENFSSPEHHPLNLQIGTLLSSYTKGMNNRYNRTGSLFQQRTKAVAVETENYALTCFHYIHQNPLKAGLVHTQKDWPFSSYPDYCAERDGTLVTKKFTLDMLNIRPEGIEEASTKAIDPDKIKKLFEE